MNKILSTRPLVLVILAARDEFVERKDKVSRLFSFTKVLRADNSTIARTLIERYGDAFFIDPYLYIGKNAALHTLRRTNGQ